MAQQHDSPDGGRTLRDLARRLRRRLAGWLGRGTGRPGPQVDDDADGDGGADGDVDAEVAPTWPVPQLATPAGAPVTVGAVVPPTRPVPDGAERAHPNRLDRSWDRLVVDPAAFVGAGVWAGAFTPIGHELAAALEHVAAQVEVELDGDLDSDELVAGEVDVERVRRLPGGAA